MNYDGPEPDEDASYGTGSEAEQKYAESVEVVRTPKRTRLEEEALELMAHTDGNPRLPSEAEVNRFALRQLDAKLRQKKYRKDRNQ